MPTRTELKSLAELRLQEARVLFEAHLYDGAAYLCGYVVELALKARICRVLRTKEYPPPGVPSKLFTVHEYEHLLTLTALRDDIDEIPQLKANWSLAIKWKPEQRYSAPGTVTRQDAEDTLNAIGSRPNGVLPWLKKHW